MANEKFTAVITLPVSAKGILKEEKIGRGTTEIKTSGTTTTIKITAADMASFRASVNSVLRDLTVIEAVSKTGRK